MSYLSLRKPVINNVKTEIFGQDVFIRRISSDEQSNYAEMVDSQKEKGLSDRDIAVLGVNLILTALVNEDGSAPAKEELPTAEELLAIHSNGDLLMAISRVQQHGWGSLESVQDAVKN